VRRAQPRLDGIALRLRPIPFLAALFAFTFPLSAFGVMVGGYPVTLPFIALVLLAASMLFASLRGRKIRANVSCWFVVFVVWAALGAVAKGEIRSLLSVAVLTLVGFPLLTSLEREADVTSVLRWFVRGGLATLPVAAYELVGGLLSWPKLAAVLPFALISNTERIGSLERTMATFPEPAGYAIYLVFVLGVLELFGEAQVAPGRKVLYRIAFLAALATTLSLSGVVLLAVLYGSRLVLELERTVAHGSVPLPRLAGGLALAGAVGCGGMILAALGGGDVRAYFTKKLQSDLVYGASQSVLSTSVGSRLSGPIVVAAYWRHAGTSGIVSGTGFNAYEDELREMFAWAVGSTAEKGSVPNVFVAVLLGTGVVGVALYVGFVLSLRPRRWAGDARMRWASATFVAWMVAHFATGQLVVYPLLGYAYLFGWFAAQRCAPMTGMLAKSPGGGGQ